MNSKFLREIEIRKLVNKLKTLSLSNACIICRVKDAVILTKSTRASCPLRTNTRQTSLSLFVESLSEVAHLTACLDGKQDHSD